MGTYDNLLKPGTTAKSTYGNFVKDPFTWEAVTITRQGELVGTFQIRFCKRTVRPRSHEGPLLEKGQVEKFLVFQNKSAAVKTGDLVTFTDGTLALLYEARTYPFSLQCDLQMILGLPYNVFSPSTVSASIDDATGNVKDVVYSPSTPSSLLVYLEPMAASDKILTNIGRADTRMAYGYSIVPITTGQVLSLNSEYWFADRESDEWTLIGVYRTNFRRLINKPSGVS